MWGAGPRREVGGAAGVRGPETEGTLLHCVMADKITSRSGEIAAGRIPPCLDLISLDYYALVSINQLVFQAVMYHTVNSRYTMNSTQSSKTIKNVFLSSH